MVPHADTIIDPGAVMVEALHTVTADRAVATAARSNGATVRAQHSAIDIKEHLAEVHRLILKVSRLFTRGYCEEEEAG